MLEVPPPRPLFVTEKLRAPVSTFVVMVTLAFKLVEPVTIVELTVMPVPTFTEVTPSMKLVPVKTTSRVCNRLPFVGAIPVKVGTGLFTVNGRVAEVPPPGPLLVSEKLRWPVAAFAAMVIFAFKLVELVTVVEFTVIPTPTFTEVTPSMKFVPVKIASSVCSLLPLVGAMLVKVGTGLFAVSEDKT